MFRLSHLIILNWNGILFIGYHKCNLHNKRVVKCSLFIMGIFYTSRLVIRHLLCKSPLRGILRNAQGQSDVYANIFSLCPTFSGYEKSRFERMQRKSFLLFESIHKITFRKIEPFSTYNITYTEFFYSPNFMVCESLLANSLTIAENFLKRFLNCILSYC